METSQALQEEMMSVLQKEDTIVFVMSHTGRYLSLLGGTNRELYSDGSLLIGKSYPEVLGREKAAFFQSLIDKVIETGESLEVEYELSPDDFLEGLNDGPQNSQKYKGNLYPLDISPENILQKVVWVVHNVTKH